MTWNHRVLAHQDGEDVYFEIHEVYYNQKNIPEHHTPDAITVGGDNVKSIRWTLKQMKKATKKPVLWAGNKFPEEY